MDTPVWALLLVSATACSNPDVPASDNRQELRPITTAIQTDTTVYLLEWDGRGWGTNVRYRFQNNAGDTLYVVNCNGATTVAVEKKEPTGWHVIWAPITNACLSPPIRIAPGAQLDTALSLWGAPPGGNIGPAFDDTTFAGAYRLIWWNLVFHYDQDRPAFGDTVPLEYKVSNEFALRQRR